MSLTGSTSLQSGQSASIPRLAQPPEPTASEHGDETPRAAAPATPNPEEIHDAKKPKKRSLFSFGKKKTDEAGKDGKDGKDQHPAKSPSKTQPSPTMNTNATIAAAPATSATSAPSSQTRHTPASPIPVESTSTQYMIPSSPGRNLSSSPRLSSPAGSQIFERDVQESTVLIPNSPAIPSHIQTENYIPPVLDASSEAITDDHLDPDSVEIITHTSHQPALAVAGFGSEPTSAVGLNSNWADELASSFAEREQDTAFFAGGSVADSASNYGHLDTTDVRRLSFISFADVVQAEHQQGTGAGVGGLSATSQRDSMHLAGLTGLASVRLANRSPSPIRSPVSSAGGPGTSPPTSKSGSVKGLELSPARKPLGSPTSAHHMGPGAGPTVSGELNIETMTQALRRTGSGDLSGVRSMPLSPVEGPSR